MTKITEIFDIPERVHQGDFVLRLTEDVIRPRETRRDYVVTPQLVVCFDQALATDLGSRAQDSDRLGRRNPPAVGGGLPRCTHRRVGL